MKIEQTLTPSAQDIDFLREMIDAEDPDTHNISQVGFFMRDNDGSIIAGCNCFLILGTIFTDQLWVHKDHRKQGVASKLLQNVEDFGRQENCSKATICTMSFQNARSLYEKLGYVFEFERTGYSHGATCVYLHKQL